MGGWTNLDIQLSDLHDSIAESYPILSSLNLKDILWEVNQALNDLNDGSVLRPILKMC